MARKAATKARPKVKREASVKLVCVEGASRKFWEAIVMNDADLYTRWGRIDTMGQSKIERFRTTADAFAARAKMVASKRKGGYIDEAEWIATRPKVEPADEIETYGCQPGDWYAGANMGHPFEVCFVKPPTPADKALLAKRIKANNSDTDWGDIPWLWTGPWAFFFIGERFTDEDSSAQTYRSIGGVEDLFTELDKKLRVAHLVFLGIRERDPRLKGDGTPPPGPVWPGHDFASDRVYKRAARFTAKPRPAPDPAFERARAKKR